MHCHGSALWARPLLAPKAFKEVGSNGEDEDIDTAKQAVAVGPDTGSYVGGSYYAVGPIQRYISIPMQRPFLNSSTGQPSNHPGRGNSNAATHTCIGVEMAAGLTAAEDEKKLIWAHTSSKTQNRAGYSAKLVWVIVLDQQHA